MTAGPVRPKSAKRISPLPASALAMQTRLRSPPDSSLAGTSARWVISICSIVAMYQEYMGHSEVTSQTDPALSGKWNSLFTIQLVVGILSGVASSAGVVIGVLAQMSTDALVGIIVFIMAVIGIGLELLYLNYLNQMLKYYSE